MRPHELPPLTVYDDSLPVPELAGPCAALHAGDLLAEPPDKTGEWIAGVIRRLIAASTGPIAVGVRRSDYRARLEAAGWFCAAEDADLAEARSACWPGLATLRRLGIGYGNPRPSLVIVGEATRTAGQLPMASRGGTWTFAALRLLGYDELSAYVTNAYNSRRKARTKQLAALAKTFRATDPTWLALGAAASKGLKVAGIEHVAICAPTYHKQFKHSEGVAGYANRMKDAGLPHGEWWGDPPGGIPGTAEVVSLPELQPPYDIRSVAFVKGKASPREDRGGTRNRQLSAQKREAARHAFVTGEAPTLKAAAEMVGVHPQRVREAARDGNWKAEREEHQRNVTERAKEAAVESESKAMADCRKDAWKANALALRKLVKQLAKDGDIKPSEAESINRIALSLSAAGVGVVDADAEAMASKPLAELAKATLEHLERLGGA